MRARGRRAPPPRRAALAACAMAVAAATGPPAVSAQAASATDGPAATHLVMVTGLGGEPAYAEEFHGLAARLLDAARDRWGIAGSRAVWLAADPARAPGRIAGPSTVERLGAELRALADRAAPSDRILLVLLGHGSGRGEESALNLPGPDLTGSRLAELLEPLADRRVAVVNAASASGGFVPALAAPGRIVVTATAGPHERERTRFGRHFVDALAGEGADRDRDGRVSLLEAFEYARREVARSYEAEGRLLTEHALLEDDGDGQGTREPGAGAADGALAARFFPGDAAAAGVAAGADASDPEVAALLAERRRLEERMAALREEREALEPEEYARRLEALLLELARANRELAEVAERTEGRP